MQGKGLNSIRNRFTIMIVAFVAMVTFCLGSVDSFVHLGDMNWLALTAITAAASVIPGIVTYVMAGKLTGLVNELRMSAEAVAAGNFDEAINVNCNCEVGGLADSFRTMVARLNSNILRMNVLAYTDPVTQLPNRAVINHVLQRALANTSSVPYAGAAMFIDLDKFKQVNDTLGHDAGDELLRQASLRILGEGFQRSRETIDNCMTPFGELCDRPPTDIVFVRFAGDEFVAFLPGMTRREDLAIIAERVIACLEQPFRIGNTDVLIGASIGIACTPHDTLDAADLINYADLAMYSAKQSGRGRYAFFDGAMREAALQRVHIERELRDGIPRDELTVYFQPKVSGKDFSLVGVEALVRWNHPVRGLLLPGDFIDVAEQSGLIEALGDTVLRLAMAQAARWSRTGNALRISVNVSHLQFSRPGFVAKVLAMMQESGAPHGSIEIELTESTALMEPVRTMASLTALREAGIRVAIDDFGCGFSNLSQLAQLPFDTLKIDRSLVECIGVDARGESVVRAIVNMGHSLGHDIVAEGVESLKQLAFLQQQNCDVLQGYLFARPMETSALANWQARRAVNPVDMQMSTIEERLLSA